MLGLVAAAAWTATGRTMPRLGAPVPRAGAVASPLALDTANRPAYGHPGRAGRGALILLARGRLARVARVIPSRVGPGALIRAGTERVSPADPARPSRVGPAAPIRPGRGRPARADPACPSRVAPEALMPPGTACRVQTIPGPLTSAAPVAGTTGCQRASAAASRRTMPEVDRRCGSPEAGLTGRAEVLPRGDGRREE